MRLAAGARALATATALTPLLTVLRCADQDSVQMLTRNSQVGEFYVLQPPQVDPTEGGTANAKAKFTCDVLIYDEESDRHVRVTWGQALKACCITGQGNISGNTKMSHPTTGPNGMDTDGTAVAANPDAAEGKLEAWYLNALKIQAFNEQRAITVPGMQAPVAVPAYTAIDTDIRIVIARPFIEYAPRPAQSHSFDNALTVLPWCARAGT